MNAMESFLFIQILTLVHVSPLTVFRPTFPTAVVQPNAAVIQMIHKGRSPNFRRVTRTHRVDLDCLCERVNLDHSILIKYARTNDQFVDILTLGMFATMQRHLSLCLQFSLANVSLVLLQQSPKQYLKR